MLKPGQATLQADLFSNYFSGLGRGPAGEAAAAAKADDALSLGKPKEAAKAGSDTAAAAADTDGASAADGGDIREPKRNINIKFSGALQGALGIKKACGAPCKAPQNFMFMLRFRS